VTRRSHTSRKRARRKRTLFANLMLCIPIETRRRCSAFPLLGKKIQQDSRWDMGKLRFLPFFTTTYVLVVSYKNDIVDRGLNECYRYINYFLTVEIDFTGLNISVYRLRSYISAYILHFGLHLPFQLKAGTNSTGFYEELAVRLASCSSICILQFG
jgi:hypothetical protein